MFRFITVCLCLVIFSTALAIKPIPTGKSALIISFSRPASVGIISEVSGCTPSDIQALNTEGTMYKVSYLPSKIDELKLTGLLSQLPNVQVIQRDEPVYLRATIPNDSLFASQWHLNKIQAPQAWDSTTNSGINKDGDTIVIAIVDDGLHVNHPNFKNNIWINYADIPGNNIDDDNNGYIDDHYGWNFMGRNNDISDSTNYVASHGTKVAGVIGATGNDSLGACGVMWHVKLMIVNIADTGSTALPGLAFQSDVLRAFNYILAQRKLYNSSNGTKGAFVVAINGSWGVDSRFANQAPLWCAFYDTMGKYGILSAGATSNDPNNVETTGDLPSLCTSKHLLIVGATNSIDKYSNRGYGTTSVDLSAPGEGIVTTLTYSKINRMTNNYYGTMSGTSAATPMVAATIGVLHNHACQKLLDTIKANPAKGNLLLRRFILEGVDTLPDLVGRSATAGRLNVYRSLLVMQKFCDGTLSTNKITLKNKIKMFPNPGNSELNIICDKDIVSVTCYDATGKQINCEWNGSSVTFGQLAGGVYYISVTTENGTSILPYLRLSE